MYVCDIIVSMIIENNILLNSVSVYISNSLYT